MWLFIQGLCYTSILLLSNDGFSFIIIIKCSLPLKVNVKYSILNRQFGHKKYWSSYWRVAQWSVVDTCANNVVSKLLLQGIPIYRKDSSCPKGLENNFIKFIYGRRTLIDYEPHFFPLHCYIQLFFLSVIHINAWSISVCLCVCVWECVWVCDSYCYSFI